MLKSTPGNEHKLKKLYLNRNELLYNVRSIFYKDKLCMKCKYLYNDELLYEIKCFIDKFSIDYQKECKHFEDKEL